MIFKCKNCGGNVIYSPEKNSMYCPFCESENSEECKVSSESSICLCPDCGGELKLKEHTSATQCPYCDNYLILDERVDGQYKPHMLIPFKLGKERCKQTLKEKFKKYLFAPTDFLSEVRLNSMQGTYVPFWMYDYNTNCDFQGEGVRTRSWTTGNTRYTETSYYNVVRNMNVKFEKIPVDASEEMPDDVMDLMEPYNYDALEEFKPQYMSGFYAEKYNMTSDVLEGRARSKMNEDAECLLRESYAGYASVHQRRKEISVNDNTSHYALLPVWKYIYRYKEKTYPFYVNGQTGKIVGNAPVSTPKVWCYAGTLWGCMAIVCLLVCGIFSLI